MSQSASTRRVLAPRKEPTSPTEISGEARSEDLFYAVITEESMSHVMSNGKLVSLTALPCHFGGERILFQYPRCHWRRTRFLYSIHRQFTYRLRTRLAYGSQGCRKNYPSC